MTEELKLRKIVSVKCYSPSRGSHSAGMKKKAKMRWRKGRRREGKGEREKRQAKIQNYVVKYPTVSHSVSESEQ